MLPELTRVRLTGDVVVAGRTLPKGTKGTIVGVYKAGAYEVEFGSPFSALITIDVNNIERFRDS